MLDNLIIAFAWATRELYSNILERNGQVKILFKNRQNTGDDYKGPETSLKKTNLRRINSTRTTEEWYSK